MADYVHDCAAGAFALTGSDVPERGVSGAGAFVLAGQAAEKVQTYLDLAGAAGSFAETGQDAWMGRVGTSEAGVFTVTGRFSTNVSNYLPTWIRLHRADATRATFWLVALDLTPQVFLTDCDQPITYGADVYEPVPLAVRGVQADSTSSSGNGGSLFIAAGGEHWEAIIAAISAGTRTFSVVLAEAWLDPALLPSAVPPADGVRTVALTRVEAAEWDSAGITFTLGPNADPSLGRLPFREYASICTYRKFRGAQCAYAGAETTCDRTWARCYALGNSSRFGGFISMPPDSYTVTWTYWIDMNLYEDSRTFNWRAP